MDDKALQKKIVLFMERADEIRQEIDDSNDLDKKKALFSKVLDSMGLDEQQQLALFEEGEHNMQQAQLDFEGARYEECEKNANLAYKLLPFDERPVVLLLHLNALQHVDKPNEVQRLKTELAALNPNHPLLAVPIAKKENNSDSPMRVWVLLTLVFVIFCVFILAVLYKLSNG